jgi:ribosomal-protein-alanine N-acetyltransferase
VRFGARSIPRLTSGDVSLRPVRHVDGQAWSEVRARNRDWCGPWDPTPPPGATDQPQSFGEMIRSLRLQAREGQSLPWFVWYRGANSWVLVGQLTVNNIVMGSARWGSIGYWVDEAWAGRGIIPRAVAMATDYCFRTLLLHRIELCIRPENDKSIRVAQKLGFRYEGRRERYLHIAGDWRDHDVFVVNSEDAPDGVLARFEQNSTRGDGAP